jgi:hypothetical protein
MLLRLGVEAADEGDTDKAWVGEEAAVGPTLNWNWAVGCWSGMGGGSDPSVRSTVPPRPRPP